MAQAQWPSNCLGLHQRTKHINQKIQVREVTVFCDSQVQARLRRLAFAASSASAIADDEVIT